MNLATRVLLGGMAFALPLCTERSVAANPLTEIQLVMSHSALGQQLGSQADFRQQQELLQQARGLMRQGDYEQASTLIRQAEQLQVPEDLSSSRFQDSPAKARRDLNDLRGAQTDPNVVANRLLGKPADDTKQQAVVALQRGREALVNGQTMAAINFYQQAVATGADFGAGEFTPAMLRQQLESAGVQPSLLAAQPTGPQGQMDEAGAPRRIPSIDGADRSPQTLENPHVSDLKGRNSNNEAAKRMLMQARLELARGHVAMADQLVRQVRTLNVEYGPQDDSPQNVEYLLRKLNEITRAEVGPQSARQFGEVTLLQAEGLMLYGQWADAERLARQAASMGLDFSQSRVTPDRLLTEIKRRRDAAGEDRSPSGVRQAMSEMPLDGDGYPVSQGVYRPDRDATQTQPASASSQIAGNSGQRYLEEGKEALIDGDRPKARKLFEEAWKYENQLDPEQRHELKGFLSNQTNPQSTGLAAASAPSQTEAIDARQQVLLRQLIAEVTREQSASDKMRDSEPKEALRRLNQLRDKIEESAVDATYKKQLVSRVNSSIDSLENHIHLNRSQIELDERNASIKESVKDRRELKIQVEEKLVTLVDQFNELMDQNRWEEAEVIARQAREIAPDNPVVQTLLWKSKFARRTHNNMVLRETKEQAVIDVFDSIERTAIPFDDSNPYRHGDVKRWNDLTETRRRALENNSRVSEDEVEIRKALKTKVDVKFEKQSLQSVIETLGNMAGINVQLDPRGLQNEGVTYDTEITISMQQAVRLESALSHILEPLRLSYVIRDEALVVTSEAFRSKHTYVKTYNVADLVIPIPNFAPSYDMGFSGALRHGYEMAAMARQPTNADLRAATPIAPNGFLASQGNLQNPDVMAQQMPPGFIPGLRGSGQVRTGVPQNIPLGSGMMGGPAGMGGMVQPDFDSLIELITTTIVPESWEELGGPGTLSPYEQNLSLVVSQTQEIHDKLADLLSQLRRLQDLQVTIEVRFITLSDNFFERIGVNFNFDLKSNDGGAVVGSLGQADGARSVTVGLQQSGDITQDLDLKFTQNMFANTVPVIGGLAGVATDVGAQFGFAMLSDIEAFFIMQAAQGDLRSNVMQAPKVTLFNGQMAFVNDTTSRPFVTSITPVVGDFAAAGQPVIVVLNEGTTLTVQAVVSPDRRFVRLTLVPMFSRIGDVQEFTYEGTSTTRRGSSVTDPDSEDGGSEEEEEEEVRTGTTVQQPEFSMVSVSTSVSVPDGGTVLLGGIKRLSEERRERGVPVMSKIPYINRLFRNIGIGRETQSLMMMVTPRIIIQEEEEEKLGFPPE